MNYPSWIDAPEGFLSTPAQASPLSINDGSELSSIHPPLLYSETMPSLLHAVPSPMKTDGFLNWGTSELDQQAAMFSADSRHECPCCRQTVTTTLQAHTPLCFLERTKVDSNRSISDDNVAHLRSIISQLGLRTRLAMMESLYRLSKTKNYNTWNVVSSKVEAHDNAVLSLLYSNSEAESRTSPRTDSNLKEKPCLIPGEQSPASYQFSI